MDEQVRPQTRLHSLVLRAMAASAAAPSAAAAFLLSHAGEFAGGSNEQTMLLIRASQEIAYRSAAYENAALLLGILTRLGSDTQDVEIGLPLFESSRLQRHLAQSVLQTLITDGFSKDPGAAFSLAVTALTELAADKCAAASKIDSGRIRHIRDSAYADRAAFSRAILRTNDPREDAD